jgi:hypothetical protein
MIVPSADRKLILESPSAKIPIAGHFENTFP